LRRGLRTTNCRPGGASPAWRPQGPEIMDLDLDLDLDLGGPRAAPAPRPAARWPPWSTGVLAMGWGKYGQATPLSGHTRPPAGWRRRGFLARRPEGVGRFGARGVKQPAAPAGVGRGCEIKTGPWFCASAGAMAGRDNSEAAPLHNKITHDCVVGTLPFLGIDVAVHAPVCTMQAGRGVFRYMRRA
jgi:hypothetical protein